MNAQLFILVRCRAGIPTDVEVYTTRKQAYAALQDYKDACDYDDEVDALGVFPIELEVKVEVAT